MNAVHGGAAPRQGCARRPQAVPAGDEREGANLEQPDSGKAAGAPYLFQRIDPTRGPRYKSGMTPTPGALRLRIDRESAALARRRAPPHGRERPDLRRARPGLAQSHDSFPVDASGPAGLRASTPPAPPTPSTPSTLAHQCRPIDVDARLH